MEGLEGYAMEGEEGHATEGGGWRCMPRRG